MISNETMEAILQAHIRECDARDVRNTKSLDEIKGMFKGISERLDSAQKDVAATATALQKDVAATATALQKDVAATNGVLRRDINELRIRVALFLGGLFAVGQILNYAIPWLVD